MLANGRWDLAWRLKRLYFKLKQMQTGWKYFQYKLQNTL